MLCLVVYIFKRFFSQHSTEHSLNPSLNVFFFLMHENVPVIKLWFLAEETIHIHA